VDALTAVKKHFPRLEVMIGNFDTPDGAKAMFENGADVVKVGVGPGDPCRTREIGIGLPQLSAVAGCAAIARRYGKAVVADGGVKNPGGIVKSIIAGANSVMLGYLLVSTHESEAEPRLIEGGEMFRNEPVLVKIYEGSASYAAQKKRLENRTLKEHRRPEGVDRPIPVTGSVSDRINYDLMHGVASAMSYLGVRTMKELQEGIRFDLQTKNGLYEGIKKK
jgi:IMP dehydrogenase